MIMTEGTAPNQEAALLELDLAITNFSREELLAALLQADVHPKPESILPLVRTENREKLEALWDTWQHIKGLGAITLARFDEDTETAISNDPEMRRMIQKDKLLSKAKDNASTDKKEANARAKMRLRIAVYGGRLATFNSPGLVAESAASTKDELEKAS